MTLTFDALRGAPKLGLFLAMLCLAAAVSSAQAEQPRSTTIYVANMHCANCARKITRKLYTVPSVVEAQSDVKAGKSTVTHQRGQDPSPRALWVAVEQAGFKPTKLTGPSGVFTKKPQR